MKKNTLLATLVLIALALGVATVTGHIDGATAEFGGSVDLNSSGITLTAGSGTSDRVKWTDGSYIQSLSDTISIVADGNTAFGAGGSNRLLVGSSNVGPFNSGYDLGSSGLPFDAIYLENEIFWASPPTTTSDDDPVVYSVGNEKLYRKTNGYTGTCNNPTSIDIQSGIIVACS